jgi:tetratricopeptide (TPR) repeat protein
MRSRFGVGLVALVAGLILWLSSVEVVLASVDLADLERRVWVADDRELAGLERGATRAIQEQPRSAYAHYVLSQVLVRQYASSPTESQYLRQASDLAEQAVDLAPLSDFGYVALAQALDLLGHGKEASVLLEKAEQMGMRATWRAWVMRARLDAARNDGVESPRVLELLKKALADETADRAVIAPVVVTLSGEAERDETDPVLRAMERITRLTYWASRWPHVIFEESLAVSYAEAGKFAKAHEIYAKVRAREGYLREAWINDGILLYHELGKPAEAAKLFAEVLEREEGRLSREIEASLRIHLGSAWLAQSKQDQARGEFMRAMRRSEDSANTYDTIVKIYQRKRRSEDLLSFTREVARELPGQGLFYAMQGDVLSKDLNRNEEALGSFADAILLDPNRADFHGGQGLVYYRMRRYSEATRSFEKAVRLDPEDPTTRYNLACVLALSGQKEESIGTLWEAVALDPRLQQTAARDTDFASLRGEPKFREIINATYVGH